MMIELSSNEGFLIVSALFGKQSIAYGGKQLFKKQSHPRVQSVIADNHSVTRPQKHPTDNRQILLLQFVLRNRQLRLHLSGGLLHQNFAECLLASRKESLSDGEMVDSELYGDVPLHQFQHALHHQLLQEVLMQCLVTDDLPQPVTDLRLQFLHKFIASCHAANAVSIVHG